MRDQLRQPPWHSCRIWQFEFLCKFARDGNLCHRSRLTLRLDVPGYFDYTRTCAHLLVAIFSTLPVDQTFLFNLPAVRFDERQDLAGGVRSLLDVSRTPVRKNSTQASQSPAVRTRSSNS